MGGRAPGPTVTLGEAVGTSRTKGAPVDHPAVVVRRPDPAARPGDDEPDALPRESCTSPTSPVHALAARERRSTGTTPEELR